MTQNKQHSNGGFSSSVGFVLACVGSAVGLGNIWMFPYRLGEYGGAAFLIPYLLFILLFGWVGLSAEVAAGRMAGTGTLGTYAMCFRTRGKEKLGRAIGWIPLLGCLGIAIGYAVILGWVLRSLGGAVTGVLMESDPAVYFQQGAVAFGNIPWHAIMVALVFVALMFGVSGGIEKFNNILMPLFFVLFLFLAVWVAFLPGAAEGYRFLFIPDWSALLKIDTWVMAMGQAFFSLSITGSGMIVYGAYLNREVDIPKTSLRTALLDTLSALLSALVVMPAVFAFGVDATLGPSLMFVALPTVFQQMPMGRIFAVVFFLSVACAGITSLINMFESVAESLQHQFGMNRRVAVALCAIATLGVGLFLEAEADVSAWMDVITIGVTPLGAVLGAISIYYVLGWKRIRTEMELGRRKPLSNAFGVVARYLYVPLTVLILVFNVIYQGIG